MAAASWITEEEQKELLKVFPEKAYGLCYFEGGGKGTSLREAYIIERLHEVFGLGMVRIDHLDRGLEKIGNHYIGWWRGQLVILGLREDGSTYPRHAFDLGGQVEYREKNGDMRIQDAYKGMRTNAISKGVFENLLMGRELFKGETAAGQAPKSEEEKRKSEARENLIKQTAEIKAFARENPDRLRELVSAYTKGSKDKYTSLSATEKAKFYVFFKTNK